MMKTHNNRYPHPVSPYTSPREPSPYYSPRIQTRAVDFNGYPHRSTKPEPVYDEALVHLCDPNSKELNIMQSEWREILIEPQPFASGGVSDAFLVRIVSDDKPGPLHVAKRNKLGHGIEGIEEAFLNMQLGKEMASKFNNSLQKCGLNYSIEMLTWDKWIEIGQTLFSLEPHIRGTFTKYNNIFGMTEFLPNNNEQAVNGALADAFSHFSFIGSGHRYILLDIQGVGTKFTDVAAVSRKPRMFGFTDTGPSSIQNYFMHHQCNHICRSLGLPHINGLLPPIIPIRNEEYNSTIKSPRARNPTNNERKVNPNRLNQDSDKETQDDRSVSPRNNYRKPIHISTQNSKSNSDRPSPFQPSSVSIARRMPSPIDSEYRHPLTPRFNPR